MSRTWNCFFGLGFCLSALGAWAAWRMDATSARVEAVMDSSTEGSCAPCLIGRLQELVPVVVRDMESNGDPDGLASDGAEGDLTIPELSESNDPQVEFCDWTARQLFQPCRSCGRNGSECTCDAILDSEVETAILGLLERLMPCSRVMVDGIGKGEYDSRFGALSFPGSEVQGSFRVGRNHGEVTIWIPSRIRLSKVTRNTEVDAGRRMVEQGHQIAFRRLVFGTTSEIRVSARFLNPDLLDLVACEFRQGRGNDVLRRLARGGLNHLPATRIITASRDSLDFVPRDQRPYERWLESLESSVLASRISSR